MIKISAGDRLALQRTYGYARDTRRLSLNGRAPTDGKKIKVPPGVRAALQTKYRGQDLGPKALAILGFFNEKPVLKATQRKVDDSSPHDPLALTSAAANVSTELSLKADPPKKWISGYNRIICARLLEHVLECKHVPDDGKLKLTATSGSSSAAAKKWKLEYDAKQVAQKTRVRQTVQFLPSSVFFY